MGQLESVMVVVNHMVDVEESLIDNICHKYEHNLQQTREDEATNNFE